MYLHYNQYHQGMTHITLSHKVYVTPLTQTHQKLQYSESRFRVVSPTRVGQNYFNFTPLLPLR